MKRVGECALFTTASALAGFLHRVFGGSTLSAALTIAALTIVVWELAHRVRRRYRRFPFPPENPESKFRAFVRQVLMARSGRYQALLVDVEKLVEKIKWLETDNHHLREMHQKNVLKIGEQEGELAQLRERSIQDRKNADASTERLVRLQQKGQRLETQLQDIIQEVERIYRQNSHLEEFQHLSSRLGKVLQNSVFSSEDLVTPVDETPAGLSQSAQTIARQASEIRQLKELLLTCRDTIVDIEQRLLGRL
jgi:chromosome segregation ATPase